MKEKEMIDKMQQNIVIPDIVQKKADYAFQKIQKENKKVVKMHSYKRKWKMVGIAVAAAVLTLGTTVCAAVYLYHSKGLESEFEMTPEEKQLLEEQEYMSPIMEDDSKTSDGVTAEGVTVEGVTVTPMQMIVDSRFAWLSFRVEGYNLEEGKEPCFDSAQLIFNNDEEAWISYYSSFYDGMHQDEDGKFRYEDGTLAYDAEGNLVSKYVDEDGGMDYIIEVDGTNYERGLIGSSVHVTFQGLGTAYKAEYFADLEATWEFDIDLKGSDEVRKATLSEPLGDSGATVVYAEISPISLHVEYDFPLRKEPVEAVNENGETIMTSDFVEAPDLMGVRLKDGTLLLHLMNGGSMGYEPGNEDIYVVSYATDRVIDPAQVDALLFKKSEPEVGENMLYQWKEENLYIVPIE